MISFRQFKYRVWMDYTIQININFCQILSKFQIIVYIGKIQIKNAILA